MKLILSQKSDLCLLNREKLISSEYDLDDINNLNSDAEFSEIQKFVNTLDSNANFYKVESHMILTTTLFLMYTHKVKVSFFHKKIYFTTNEFSYEIPWIYKEDLLSILWRLRESTKYNENDSYFYDDYRQETRQITDHLNEDHNPRKTWTDILSLTHRYMTGAQ